MRIKPIAACAAALLLFACPGKHEAPPTSGASAAPRPNIVFITLDTTRADAIGPEAVGVETPAFDALARRGRGSARRTRRCRETLPSHASMLTGLYPAGHGVHENARYLPAGPAARWPSGCARPATARRPSSRPSCWRGASASRAASTSTTTSSRPGRAERTPRETTDAALAYLGRQARRSRSSSGSTTTTRTPPTPRPSRSARRYATNPYLGEVAAMDEQLGRLVQAFEQRAAGPLGDRRRRRSRRGPRRPRRGAARQAALPVDDARAAGGRRTGRRRRASSDAPVSTRRVFHTILDWAGLGATHSLRGRTRRRSSSARR